MGALMFFLMFIWLIPVCAVIMDILGRMGILGDLSDPAEWDAPEEEEQDVSETLPEIVMMPEPSERKVV